MNDVRQDWISKRAYALWEQEGRPSGRDQDHWQQATRERDEFERLALPGMRKGKTKDADKQVSVSAARKPKASAAKPPRSKGATTH